MSQFGTQYVPSLTGVTGFMAAEILQFLAKARENQIKNVQLFQNSQLSATQGYAAAEQDTINKQANAEEDQAEGTILQGAIGLAGPIVSSAYEFRRSDVCPNFLKDSELKQMNLQGENIQAWRNTLENERLPVKSASEDGAIEMDVINDHSPNRVNDQELDALRRKNYGASRPDEDSDSELVKSLKTLRGGSRDEEDPDPIKRKQLYKDVEKKLDDQEQSLQNKRQRYDNRTDLVSKRFQELANAIASLGQGVKQKDAAEERKDQAAAQAVQEYARYNNDSQTQAVQTGTKVWEDINQALQQTSRSYFEDLARANQPV